METFYKIQRDDGLFYAGPAYKKPKWVVGGKIYGSSGAATRSISSGRRTGKILASDKFEVVEFEVREIRRFTVTVT